MPTFEFREWLAGLIVACAVLVALSRAVARGAKGTRIAAYVFAILMLFNAAGHTLGSIFGQTVASATFPRPAPGFWSSPIMAATAIYLLVELRRSGKNTRYRLEFDRDTNRHCLNSRRLPVSAPVI